LAAVTNSTSTTIPESGPSGRLNRPRENADLIRYYLTAIDSTDTFTPFPLPVAGVSGSVQRQIYDWAIQPVSDADTVDSVGDLAPGVNAGNGAEMKVVYTKATSSAAAYFTFTCTAGSGKCYFYLWAK
jgi:hypothetical protein